VGQELNQLRNQLTAAKDQLEDLRAIHDRLEQLSQARRAQVVRLSHELGAAREGAREREQTLAEAENAGAKPEEFYAPEAITTLDQALQAARDYQEKFGDSGVVRGLLRDLEELRRMESDLDANRGTAEVSEFARRHLQGWVLSIFQPLAHVDPANPPDHHEDPREPLSDRLRSFITTKRLELRDRLEREIGLQEIPVRADTEQYSPSDPLRRHTVVEWRIDNRGAIPGTIHRVVRPGYWLTGPTVLRPEVLRPAEVSVYASPA